MANGIGKWIFRKGQQRRDEDRRIAGSDDFNLGAT